MKTSITLLLFFFLLPLQPWCGTETGDETEEDHFTPFITTEKYATLKKHGEMVSVMEAGSGKAQGDRLILIPDTTAAQRIRTDVSKMEPTIGVELLFLHSRGRYHFIDSSTVESNL